MTVKGREREGLGVWNEQMETTVYRMNGQGLLYSTRNYIQHPVINHSGEHEEEHTHTHTHTHTHIRRTPAVQQKSTQHCQPTILQ